MWCVTFTFFFWTNINLNNIHRFPSFTHRSFPASLSFSGKNKLICWLLVSAENVITVYDCPSVGTMLNGTSFPFSSLFFLFFFFTSSFWSLIQKEIVIHVYRIALHLWAPCWMARVSCFLSFLLSTPSFTCLSGHELQVSQGENFTSLYTTELTVGLLCSSLSESDPANLIASIAILPPLQLQYLPCTLYPKSTTPALYKLADLQEDFSNWCLTLIFRVGDF